MILTGMVILIWLSLVQQKTKCISMRINFLSLLLKCALFLHYLAVQK